MSFKITLWVFIFIFKAENKTENLDVKELKHAE